MERKLASIQIVHDVQPIPNADAIEVASILGWKVVVKKSEFHVGDKCVYCEVDSILPERPEFEFLRSRNFRIKTVRLRKQLSQGIAFPLSVLPEGDYEAGHDVTELLGVTKYEPPIPIQLSGIVKGAFPARVPKTDEIRVQSAPEVIAEITGKEVYITTKVDGTSATFANWNGEIDVCSRRLNLKEAEGNLFWDILKKYRIDDVLRATGNIAIQGECCGPSIQKNRLGLSEHELFVFNVYNIQKGAFLDYKDFLAFCGEHHLQPVPVEEVGLFHYTLEQLIERAKGTYKNGKLKEGIVVRPTIETYSDVLGGRMSFKVLNNDFLEKEEE